MEFVVDDNLVRVKATGDGWSAERQEIPSVQETRVIRGTIKGSLYESGVDAGLSPQHILDLAKIFEYDIDFLSDLQRGDAFSAIVEERPLSDGRRQIGRILAAELEAGRDVVRCLLLHEQERRARNTMTARANRCAGRFCARL